MSEQADQVVLEYLGRANDVAHRYLGSQERLDFMTRLRRRIEDNRAETGGATKPEQVRKVLARFGDPETLVRQERRRLDGGDTTTRPDPRGTTSDTRRTAADAGRPAARPSQADGPFLSPRPSWSAGQFLSRLLSRPAQPRLPDQPAQPAQPRQPSAGPADPAGPVRPAPVAGGGAVDLEGLFRRYPVEVGAIALIGLGGLLLPVPLWIFGAAAGALSRVWTTREKVTGLVVPALVAAVAAAALGGAGALGGVGTGDMPPLLHLAGPVGAGYLGWRLLRAVGARTVRITRARARRR